MIGIGELGQRIAVARRAQPLTQIELARRVGISRATIDLLENGRAHEIGYSKLIRILAAVGLELSLRAITPKRPTLDDLLQESVDD
jgi:transcriptional regulator with XRE-family HTH domain